MLPIKLLCSIKTLWPLMVLYKSILCNPIVKTLSENIRDYATKENGSSTAAVTLHNLEEFRHATGLANNHVKFKEIADTDNTLSGSSYSRGLLHQDHAVSGGFPPAQFIEHPVPPQLEYEFGYRLPDEHHFSIPEYHHGGHGNHFGHHHGHRHKPFGYDIATKAVLWPIAGLALLGAAAALVTNPILLQLGVVSGRRRRRDTEKVLSGPDYMTGFNYNYSPFVKNDNEQSGNKVQNSYLQAQNNFRTTTMPPKPSRKPLKRRLKSKWIFNKVPSTEKTDIASTLDDIHNGKLDNNDGFIPIPLKKKIN